MPRSVQVLILALALAARPAAAQVAPDVQRLEELRLQRMKDALSLTEEEMDSLRTALEEIRGESRRLRETQREAMEALREALRREPPDGEALGRALESLEGRRAETERLREEHRRRLSDVLGPEQRARFLLFNHHFNSRLRELMERRLGAPPAAGRRGIPLPPPPADRRGPLEGGSLEQRLRRLPPAERRQAIERLRAQLDRLERSLEAEEPGD